MHADKHPQAGQEVTVNPAAPVFNQPNGAPFRFEIEDWQDRVFGQSWMDCAGNPAALGYAARSAVGGLPLDNNVVYGHGPQGLGHMIHVSEIQN